VISASSTHKISADNTARANGDSLDLFLERTRSSDYQEYLGGMGYAVDRMRQVRFSTDDPMQLYQIRGDSETIQAVGRISPLAWDSEVLKFPVARIDVVAGTDGVSSAKVIRAMTEQADRSGVRMLTARVRGDDFPTLHALEHHGFRLMDTLTVFLLDRNRPLPFSPKPMPDGVSIEPLNPEDRDKRRILQEIAAESFRSSRVMNDPGITPSQASRFFRRMSEDLLNHPGALSLVALNEGHPVGFAVGQRDDGLSSAIGRNIGYLWLIGVASQAAGRGVGGALLRRFAADFLRRFDLLEIATQSCNLEAMNLYVRHRLPVVATSATLHRHTGR